MTVTLATTWPPLVGAAQLACGRITIGANPDVAKSWHCVILSPGLARTCGA